MAAVAAIQSDMKDIDLRLRKAGGGPSHHSLGMEEWARLVQAQERLAEAAESLVVSQAVPQLIRHIQIIHRAMVKAGTRLYLKIGTTGTGGMGLNIPYTHGEDKPSSRLMSKTAVAFAHTGLLFLMARTPKGPIVKEIKPAAMVGYKRVTCRVIKERGSDRPRYIYASRAQRLAGTLLLQEDTHEYRRLAKMEMPIVDTGENGQFTRGEFETITSLQQMEFVTPEEIASQVVLEIMGANTGVDVIAAIDGAIMNPSYRAGYIRQAALDRLGRLEREKNMASVALGELGPPELGKLLYEAYLLKVLYGTLPEALAHPPAETAEQAYAYLLAHDDLRNLIVSVGLPVISPDGVNILRGPVIRIPEGETQLVVSQEDIDTWAAKCWVDLRPANWGLWHERLAAMLNAARYAHGEGSAAITRKSYLGEDIRIGDVVAWIFNSDAYRGYRIK